MPSEGQIKYLEGLLKQRVVPQQFSGIDVKELSVKDAHDFITVLKAQPFVDGREAIKSEPATEGYYLYNNEMYHVVPGKENRCYAKILIKQGNKGRWDYIKGMVYTLKEEHRVTLDLAKSFGKQYGFCMVCGRTLSDPVSISYGIGPICATRV